MKRTIYLVIALICALNANAQFTQNETQTNSTASNFQSLNQHFDSYKYWELGYCSEGGANGAFVGWIISKPFYKGLSFDVGMRAQWNMVSIPSTYYYEGDSFHYVGMKFLLGASYQINLSEDITLIPNTGARLGFIGGCFSEGETDFVMGWDFGARLKYKRFFLSYAATVGITGQGTTHSVGIGLDI